MALQVWLPLNKEGDFQNRGLANITVTNNGATYNSSGKIGGCYVGSCASRQWMYAEYSGGTSEFMTKFINNHSFTLAAWAKTSSQTALLCITYGVGLFSDHFTLYRSSGSQTCWNDSGFDGNWHHYCGTYDVTTGKMTFYIDGVQVSTNTIENYESSWTNATIGIGRDFNNSTADASYFIEGSISDVRIYDHCLSPKEVKEISKALVLHYPLNDTYVEGTTNLANQSNMGGWINSGSRTVNYNDTTLPNVPTSQQVYSMTATSDGSIAMTCGLTGTVASKTIVASVYVWLDGAQNGSGVYVRSNKTDDSVGYLQYNGTANAAKWPTKQWIRIVSDAITMPSDATTVYLCTYLGVNTQYVAMNGWQIEENDHATPFTSSTRTATTVYDCSGYSNNGTIKGSLSCVDDSPRYNVSTQVSNGNNINFNFNPSFVTTGSISFWAKYTSPGSCGTLPFTGQDGYYYIMACSSTGSWYNGTVSGTLTYYKDGIVATNPRETGEWHHFVITGINLSSWTAMYLNKYGSDNSCWNSTAQFSDIRIYNTVLSADDVKELYSTSCIITNQ